MIKEIKTETARSSVKPQPSTSACGSVSEGDLPCTPDEAEYTCDHDPQVPSDPVSSYAVSTNNALKRIYPNLWIPSIHDNR